jgi:hypothetical protein
MGKNNFTIGHLDSSPQIDACIFIQQNTIFVQTNVGTKMKHNLIRSLPD